MLNVTKFLQKLLHFRSIFVDTRFCYSSVQCEPMTCRNTVLWQLLMTRLTWRSILECNFYPLFQRPWYFSWCLKQLVFGPCATLTIFHSRFIWAVDWVMTCLPGRGRKSSPDCILEASAVCFRQVGSSCIGLAGLSTVYPPSEWAVKDHCFLLQILAVDWVVTDLRGRGRLWRVCQAEDTNIKLPGDLRCSTNICFK